MKLIEETVVDKKFIKETDKLREPKDKTEGLLKVCSESVIIFSEHMLGIKLRAWQVYFLNKLQNSINGKSDIKKFLALTSRQVGKSWGISIFALWVLTFNKYHGGGQYKNSQIGIVSASDDQAKKLLKEIKRFINLGDIHMRDKYDGQFGNTFFTDLVDKRKANNTTTITFMPNKDSELNYDSGDLLLKDSKIGSYIVSLPPTSKILGYTFSILLVDEVGKSDKVTDEFLVDFAEPTTNDLDAITIYTSTPWTPSGRFYEAVKAVSEGKGSFDTVLFTIDCIKLEDYSKWKKVQSKITELNSQGMMDAVRRAYYCEFVKGESNYFDPDRVNEAFKDTEYKLPMYIEECDMGVDFGGQVKSRTVLTISRVDEDGEVYRLYDKVYEVGKDLSLINDIEELKTRFNIQRIIPDDCPAGDYLIRKMIEEKGWNVTPMNFRRDKVKKYGAFRAMLNKGKIHSYIDEDLRTEMLAIENSQGKQSSVISAPSGYNDDKIDSFVMSCYYFIKDDTTSFKIFDWEDY